jgi:eukaryotic-like serine/threonine-protein kinase
MLPEWSVGAWALVALVAGAAYGLGWFAGSRRRAPSVPPSRSANEPAVMPPRPDPAPTPIGAPAADASAPLLGPDRATLGRYRIDRQIGRGSMGTVYLGHDPQIGRPVAIKTMALSREFEGTELAAARARFFREAEVAGRLQHRDIVTVFDANEEQGLAFIAMEYVKGHDLLRHTLPGTLLPLPQVLRTLARVAQALAHAHTQGVVHRDVKPANVMIDPQTDSVKVTDFGIARITDACRTRTGLVLGTPSFMSPEQMAGRRVDGRSDLYSLGVMLFQMLTGALPHRSESMAQLMNQIANDTAPDVRTLRPELPEALANVVALALEKRVEVRYADGNQMAADLLEVAQMLELRGPEPPAPGVTDTPDSGGFEATAEFSRTDPRHNADH